MDNEFPNNNETGSHSNTTATGLRFTSDDINDVFVVPTSDDIDELMERGLPLVTPAKLPRTAKKTMVVERPHVDGRFL
jgi:hypothetical protein